jgi:hypothetical protein
MVTEEILKRGKILDLFWKKSQSVFWKIRYKLGENENC